MEERRLGPWLGWLGVAAVLVGLLSWRLATVVHPWEVVLEIPSETPQEDGAERGIIALSPDDARLVTARPDGTCELWNLDSLTKEATMGEPYRGEAGEARRDGARHLQFTADGRILFVRDEELFLFDRAGATLGRFAMDDWSVALAIAPDGSRIANAGRGVTMAELSSGAWRPLEGADRHSGQFSHLEWFSDSRRLLVSTRQSVLVSDTDTNAVVFRHGGLDLRLPSPMLLDDPAKLEQANWRDWFVVPHESRLADDESKVVTIYHGSDFFRRALPEGNRLRAYDAHSGAMLSDQRLPHPPRQLAVSADQSRVYVLMCPDFRNLLQVYEAKSMTLLSEVSYKLCNRFPPGIAAAPHHGFVITHSNQTWIVDPAGTVAPLRLHEWLSDVSQVEITKDSATIVTAKHDKSIHVWRKRRDSSRWGALVHWEYHLAYLAGVLGVCGLLVQLGRRRQREAGIAFPCLFWLVVLFLGVSLGGTMVDLVVEPIVGKVFVENDERTAIEIGFKLVMIVLSLAMLAGLVRLSSGWRKCALIYLGLLVIGTAVVGSWLAWKLLNLGAVPSSVSVILKSGVRLEMPVWLTVLGMVPAYLVVLSGCWWVIFQRSTRALFTGPAADPGASGEGPG